MAIGEGGERRRGRRSRGARHAGQLAIHESMHRGDGQRAADPGPDQPFDEAREPVHTGVPVRLVAAATSVAMRSLASPPAK
jgi:hypothetical protein